MKILLMISIKNINIIEDKNKENVENVENIENIEKKKLMKKVRIR